jgi:hypothetical protein
MSHFVFVETAPTSNRSECDHVDHIEFAHKRKYSSESARTVFGPHPSNAVMTSTCGASDLTGILHRLSITEIGTRDETNNKRRKISAAETPTDINDHETTQTFVDPLLNQLTPPPSSTHSNTSSAQETPPDNNDHKPTQTVFQPTPNPPSNTSSATSSTISTPPSKPRPTDRNPFHRTFSQQSNLSPESTYSFSSTTSSYSGLDCRTDPLAHHAARLEEMRRYFARNEAWTRYQRRKYLYALNDEHANIGARWLQEFPSDLWDTKAEEKAGWSRMYADGHAEEVAKVFEETGFYDQAGCEELYAGGKFEGARARAVGWVGARQ